MDDTSSEYRSFAQNFFSLTEELEIGLSETEKRKRTDPQFLKAIPVPNLFSVLSSGRGEDVRDKLEGILNEYEDLFMNNQADIGWCKVAKRRI